MGSKNVFYNQHLITNTLDNKMYYIFSTVTEFSISFLYKHVSKFYHKNKIFIEI